ncbi:WXG100 family type VII secretion target [Alkaliphilus transvaalensis]|uniref:WXG100 family type VII secretion target n=1 Tax=Alkaliphilus transvaalensis TaxID=114628 RepID=UPI00047CED79|nr:WXG100 family type VII secretion target [Alkaliphilus transvaalensis]
MSSPSSINRVAKRVNDTAYNIKTSHNKLTQDVNGVGGWWQGEASKTFISEYNQISSEINKLTRQVESLESRLKSLASAVSRADEERRQEALRKRLQEEQLRLRSL